MKKETTKKKILSILLALAIILPLAPHAFADGETGNAPLIINDSVGTPEPVETIPAEASPAPSASPEPFVTVDSGLPADMASDIIVVENSEQSAAPSPSPVTTAVPEPTAVAEATAEPTGVAAIFEKYPDIQISKVGALVDVNPFEEGAEAIKEETLSELESPVIFRSSRLYAAADTLGGFTLSEIDRLTATDKNYNQAVQQTRENFKDRVPSFKISFKSDSDVDYKFKIAGSSYPFLDDLYRHTGNGKEGDSIQWQMEKVTVSGITKINIDGAYYYDMTVNIIYYDTASQEANLDAQVATIVSSLGLGSGTDYEKVYKIFKYLTDNVTFLDDSSAGNICFTAYGALIRRQAVCQGVSLAFYRLCLESGIDARLVDNTEISHAWNIAKIGSSYYNFDATWSIGTSPWKFFALGDETTGYSSGGIYFKPEHTHAGTGKYQPAWLASYCSVSSKDYPCFVPGVKTNNFVAIAGSEHSDCVAGADGKCVRCGQTVSPAGSTAVRVTGIKLDLSSASIETSAILPLTATVSPANASDKTVIWTTSDSNIATVNKNGSVTGLKAGNATITATTKDGAFTAICALTVKLPVSPKPTATPTTTPVIITSPTPAPVPSPLPTPVIAPNSVFIGESRANAVIYADGVQVAMDKNGYITLPNDNVKAVTSVTYNSSDTKTNYPVPSSMRVWFISKDSNGVSTAVRSSAFDGIMQYAGASIRITGNKGIRMITGIPVPAKTSLTGSGLNGWTLVENGTVVANDSSLNGSSLTLSASGAKHAAAYKKGSSDPVFSSDGSISKFTNGLIFDSMDKCKPVMSIRPYMTITNGKDTVTLYGGVIHRSIGYVAYQNRNAFSSGTAAYDYIWSIIRACGLG